MEQTATLRALMLLAVLTSLAAPARADPIAIHGVDQPETPEEIRVMVYGGWVECDMEGRLCKGYICIGFDGPPGIVPYFALWGSGAGIGFSIPMLSTETDGLVVKVGSDVSCEVS